MPWPQNYDPLACLAALHAGLGAAGDLALLRRSSCLRTRVWVAALAGLVVAVVLALRRLSHAAQPWSLRAACTGLSSA